jgi:zinc resistance-associated protein
MLKSLLVGATALTIAGSSLVYAQQQRPADAAATQQEHAARGARFRPTAEDVAALTDARIAALKAGLKLTPEQEKNWPAVETAIRDLAKERAARVEQRTANVKERRNTRSDMIERLRQRADRMTNAAANLKRFADATEPLYKSLDESQKRRFTLLSRQHAGQWRAAHWAARERHASRAN